VLITAYLNTRRKRAKTGQEACVKLFAEECVRCKLEPHEISVLRALAAFAPDSATKAHTIFTMPVLFERCEEEYVSRELLSGAGEGQENTLRSLRHKLGFSVLLSEQQLISTRNVMVGQPVTVFMQNGSQQWTAEVAHVGEFRFTLRPVRGESGIIGQPGAEATLLFVRQGDATYTVAATIAGSGAGVGELSMYHSVKFKRRQNREYMRLDTNMPLAYKVLESSNREKQTTGEAINGHTSDISGGGLSFLSETPLGLGDVILLSIQIPGYSMGGILAKILKVIPIAGRSATQYKHMAKFTTIEPQQRERIVKYIFEKQRETLQMR
jgi:c-di-GMP-binding flagellar brake protein YcgR